MKYRQLTSEEQNTQNDYRDRSGRSVPLDHARVCQPRLLGADPLAERPTRGLVRACELALLGARAGGNRGGDSSAARGS